ncbi:MAG TPA: hypothetical protein PLL10_09150, partial [Elusimicrobiales bacterium]|nr:hypothetical protein [Elusimicrobiales bacterium]
RLRMKYIFNSFRASGRANPLKLLQLLAIDLLVPKFGPLTRLQLAYCAFRHDRGSAPKRALNSTLDRVSKLWK